MFLSYLCIYACVYIYIYMYAEKQHDRITPTPLSHIPLPLLHGPSDHNDFTRSFLPVSPLFLRICLSPLPPKKKTHNIPYGFPNWNISHWDSTNHLKQTHVARWCLIRRLPKMAVPIYHPSHEISLVLKSALVLGSLHNFKNPCVYIYIYFIHIQIYIYTYIFIFISYIYKYIYIYIYTYIYKYLSYTNYTYIY